MKSFLQFLHESMSKRAFDNYLTHPDGSVALNHPDAPLIHSEPDTKIYHLKTPQACYAFGSGMRSTCTNTPHTHHAHTYLKDGNVFMIHHGNGRTQHWVAHDDEYKAQARGIRSNYGLNTQSSGAWASHNIPENMKEKMYAQPHTGFKGKWEKPKPPAHPLTLMSHDELIHHIKSLPTANERIGHIIHLHTDPSLLKGKHGEMMHRISGDTPQRTFDLSREDVASYTAGIYGHLRNSGVALHHFSDDPDASVRAHIAAYAHPNTIQHMAADPDAMVRHVVKQRLEGGPLNKPHPTPEPIGNERPKGKERQFFLPFKHGIHQRGNK